MAITTDVTANAAEVKSEGLTPMNVSQDDLNSSGYDAEKQSATEEPAQLQRTLKNRHLQMIAIGGTVGTGLFISSGTALAKAGPVGALIAYLFVATIVYSVMVALGEMVAYIPIAGAFTAYATRFVDPSLGFAMGWIYWFAWAITFALELSAAGIIIQYWNESLNIAIFIGVFWAVFTAVNFLPVKAYAEVEFWFASIKCITIVGFMIFAICIDAGAGQQGYLGFHYWTQSPGPFAPYLLSENSPDYHTGTISGPVGSSAVAKFVGFWAVLIQAGFAYQGTELVGIAAGETENPRKTIPIAIKKTFWYIVLLFCLTIFFIGLLVPCTDSRLQSGASDASASPFVIAASIAGVSTLPHIINAVLLTAVLSAANSNVYSGSRVMVGLVESGHAPQFLAKTIGRTGVPYIATLATSLIGLLGFLNVSSAGQNAFNWLTNISSVASFLTWACLNASHLGFMRALKARNMPRNDMTLPFVAPFQPWLSWYGLGFNVLIILTQGFTSFLPWNTTNFFVAYISVILFVALYAGHKLVSRCPVVKPELADIDSGRREADEEDAAWEERVPVGFWQKLAAWI